MSGVDVEDNTASEVEERCGAQEADGPAVALVEEEDLSSTVHEIPIIVAEGSDESMPPVTVLNQAVKSILFCLGSLLVMCFSLNIVTRRMPEPRLNPQLPDILFELFPPLDIVHWTDGMMWAGNLTLALMVFFIFPWRQWQAVKHLHKNGHISTPLSFKTVFTIKYHVPDAIACTTPFVEHLKAYRNINFRLWTRYCITYGLTTFVRIVSTMLTSLPSPNNECQVRPVIRDPIWNAMIGLFSFGNSNIHCGDLLISGHAIVLAANFMALWEYGPILTHLMRPWSASIFIFSWFTIIASRSHYSDDVFWANWAVFSIWYVIPEYVPRPLAWLLYPSTPNRRMAKE